MSLDLSRVTVVTATALEARAARRALPRGACVLEAGVGLSRLRETLREVAISCGLAGGLRDDLPTGTVLVPRSVRRPDGSIVQCDSEVCDRLVRAARELGQEPVLAPLLTGAKLVREAERRAGAAEGYAAADMETGFIRASRVACVRVVLDTPDREFSEAWLNPMRAILTPSAWRDLPFLAREAPRCAALAARVLAAALR